MCVYANGLGKLFGCCYWTKPHIYFINRTKVFMIFPEINNCIMNSTLWLIIYNFSIENYDAGSHTFIMFIETIHFEIKIYLYIMQILPIKGTVHFLKQWLYSKLTCDSFSIKFFFCWFVVHAYHISQYERKKKQGNVSFLLIIKCRYFCALFCIRVVSVLYIHLEHTKVHSLHFVSDNLYLFFCVIL